VDIAGIANVAHAKPDTVVALILPPSFEEWLRRVNARGPMDPAERKRRFETAAEIFAMAKDGKYPIIINDNLDEAVSQVDRLARSGELGQEQQQARETARELYQSIQEYLGQHA
jgi:guanylate kinase